MANNGVPNPNFKGFMANNAQANWNVIRIVYGSKNENELMVDKMNLFFSLELIHGHTHKTKDQVKVARKT